MKYNITIFILILILSPQIISWNGNYCSHGESGNSCSDQFVNTLTCQPPENNFRSIGTEFYFETFSELELEASLNFGGENIVTTRNLPEGWESDNTGTPEEEGCEEYENWNISELSWWVTAGDSDHAQGREEFQPGQCNRGMVADNDNHNCYKAQLPLESYMNTNRIEFQAEQNSLFLIFDHSFRPWDGGNLTGKIDVQYDQDNYEWENVLTFQSHQDQPDFKDHTLQETLIVALNNPQNSESIRLRFYFYDENNGWWWAISRIGLFSYNCQDGYFGVPNSDICKPFTYFQGEQQGSCVGGNVDENDENIVLLSEGDFSSDQQKCECLEMCQGYAHSDQITGCEAISNQDNAGCYVHLGDNISQGDGQENYTCWNMAQQESDISNKCIEKECTVLFSECNFQGEYLPLCDNNSDLGDFQVKSIYIPDGSSTTVYQYGEYRGEKETYSQSNECIDSENEDHIAFLSCKVKVEKKKDHLRMNN